MSTIKVFVPGKGEVRLTATEHVASGGEGTVYLKNGTVFKVFHHPDKARANGMAEKLELLSKISHPFIVAPKDLLFDVSHQLVGFTMSEATGVPLVKTFTNAWRDQAGFTDEQAKKLVDNMRAAVAAAHALGALIVDGNEMNYLADGVVPRLIDVDSWQIGRHAATAIMPSIRDYHRNKFDTLTDWFSWGIASFQVFTGIHPYKGTHPDFRKGDLEARMRANASVFDTKVRLNAAVRDFRCIPPALLTWYEGVFAQGDRSAPPEFLKSQVSPALTKKVRVRQSPTGKLRHERILGLPGKIRHVSANGVAFFEQDSRLTAFDLYRKQSLPSLADRDITALFENQAGLVRHGVGFVYLVKRGHCIEGRPVLGERDPVPTLMTMNSLHCYADKLIVIGNQAFALNTRAGNGLIELELADVGKRTLLAIKTAWPVNALSTRFFDGFGVMDCLGVPFIVMPDKSSMLMLRAANLAGYRLINGFGRSGDRVWVHGIKREDGQMYRLELQATSKEFLMLSETLVDAPELNIAVTSKGIAAAFFEDGVVSVRNTKGSGSQDIQDGSAGPDMRLFALPDGVFYYQNSDIFKLSLG